MSVELPAAAGTRERVGAALESLAHELGETVDALLTVTVERDDLHEAALRLRDRAGFETNTFVTAIDHFPREPRFEVACQLLSVSHNDRVRLRTLVSEDDARVPSVVDLWPGAAYAERECFDMFGIRFDGHAGLKRLMMPEEYEHYPLRKDFPHEGIEPDRLYREWDRARRAAEAAGGKRS